MSLLERMLQCPRQNSSFANGGSWPTTTSCARHITILYGRFVSQDGGLLGKRSRQRLELLETAVSGKSRGVENLFLIFAQTRYIPAGIDEIEAVQIKYHSTNSDCVALNHKGSDLCDSCFRQFSFPPTIRSCPKYSRDEDLSRAHAFSYNRAMFDIAH